MIKKVIIIPLIIVVFMGYVRFLWSQETKEDDKNTNFNFGKNSFQFRISSNFTLTDFQGSLVSYKYHLTNKLAFRFGVGIGVENNTYEDENVRISGDSIHISVESDGERKDMDLISQLVYYFKPEKEIKLYAGIGPLYSYYERKENHNITRIDTNNTIYSVNEINYKISDYGISTAYGLEWFFRKNMSLLAEYGFRFCYRDVRNEKHFSQLSPPSTIIIEKSKSNGWIFSSESVKFGLSIYL